MMAFEAMIRRSQASASESPAPAAAPGSAAIVGFGMLNSLPAVARWLTRWLWIAWSMETGWPEPVLRLSMPFTSPPAQNPLPAPVRTTTLTSGASSAQASWAASASFIGPLMALRASGRLRVSVSTPPSRSASRSLVPVSILPMAWFPCGVPPLE